MQCPSCAAEVPEGARFCPSCGHALSVLPNEERRIVTVLFADLVGFTSLAEFMDPEQAKRLVDRSFARLVDDIAEYGGRVDKLLGDGILALFGAPVGHEDDPERAVRAGLRMHETLARTTARSTPDGGVDIRMRVGINTGEVLVGTLAGTEYTAMGDVVNTASRLQSMAPPGRVIVGESTYALTAHTIDYESAGELVARGRERPIRAWLAVAATAPPGVRRRHRTEVPLVGRAAELSIAQIAVDQSIERDRAVVVSVTGENGVGKRRLVTEVLDRVASCAAHEVTLLHGHCIAYGQANPYWPVALALAERFEVDPALGPEELRAEIAARSAQISPNADPTETMRIAEVFAHVHGYPSKVDDLDPASPRSSIHWGITKALERMSDHQPTVLAVDNLHWADVRLIDLLDHLVHTLARRPFALVTAMRAGSDLAWPPHSDRVSVISLALQPLSHEETDELARSLLVGRDADDRLLDQLYERSGGNPLFLQELAGLAGVGTGELPDSLRALIGARLDQLSVAQRQVIENAATLGSSGSIAYLQKFATAINQPFNRATVRELDELGLLEVHGDRWEFRSDSVREAAYQTLTKASRAARHAGVAKGLSEIVAAGAAGPATLDSRAHHLATAAELELELGHVVGVPPTVRVDAIEALTGAATRALDAGGLRAAVSDATRALDLLAAPTDPAAPPVPDVDEVRSRLRLLRASALVDQRLYDEARADLDAVLAEAIAAGDRAAEGEARRLFGTMLHAAGRLDQARAELGLAVEILRDLDRPDLLAQALRSRGFIELFGGSLVDAEWFFGEADALFRELGDRRGMAWIEQHRAWIGFMSGDFEVAHARLQRSAETLAELGDRNGVGWVLGLLAYVEFFLCHFDVAEELANQVAVEAEERGDTWAAAMMQTLQANLRLWQGQLDEAATLAALARKRFRKLEDRYGLAQSMAPLMRAQTALGRTALALRTEEELFALGEVAAAGTIPLLAIAGAAMHRGDGALAANHATRAIAEMRAAGSEAWEPLILLSMALAQCDRLDEAVATLESLPDQEWDHPFAHAVGSLVLGMLPDPGRALAHANAVFVKGRGSSYLDRVMAHVGAAAAHARLDHPVAATASIDEAVELATSVGDVVAIALATRAAELLTGEAHPAADDRIPLADGWEHVLASLLAREPVA
ncbi:MAG: adenylate/guanylate cyclase domain-containing protein [Ilumatobacteraceae bacterium]